MVTEDLKSYTQMTNCSPMYKRGCPPHSTWKFKILLPSYWGSTRRYSCLRHCAASLKVTCSIPKGVNGIFHGLNHMVRHPRCVFINYNWINQLSNTTIWWLDIQSDSGGICTTLGNDSMSDSKQKSSCEHGSDFERLRSYGHFLIPVHGLMCTALTELADGWWLTVCIASINFASWLAQPVQFPYLNT